MNGEALYNEIDPQANGVHTWLGSFDTPEAACSAYRQAAAPAHGTFIAPGACGCR